MGDSGSRNFQTFRDQLKSDYRFARVHLAWSAKNGEVEHLFAIVELLPEEFPKPGPDSIRQKKPI